MKYLAPLFVLAFSSVAFAAEPLTIKLWPEGAPGKMTLSGTATPPGITNIADPTITIYRPEKPNGTAVVVAPGGGYNHLSIKNEGSDVCEWLKSIGVTGVLLTYRTPTRSETNMYEKPVQDAQRAIGIVRHHAAEWGIGRVGLLGFSAGGNLTAHEALDRTPRTYPEKPELDGDAKPDFIVLIYGGGFMNLADRTKFRDGFSVPADAPPAFMLVAHDDNSVDSTMLYLEYKRQKLPAELHVFTKGGHGFGMRRNGHPINDWTQRCSEWMKDMGFLEK